MTILFSKKKLSKKSIDDLYQNGYHLKTEHLTFKWKHEKGDATNSSKLIINVSKKKIKKAVDRNYIKRIIRESYRINQLIINKFVTLPNQIIIIIYNKSSMPKFDELNAEFVTLFNHIKKKLNENH
ncbi:MAG: ribonuclease P protein component [Flavobacteriales bacterium]|jgi:ribonuclease P protein component|nr:ribonuclease P protein component [Flavobacteriales bacterium]|tara:strand:- start:784 stop:1161 length:378 start_codon:yes stop_codon:yes gene_type:complete